MLRQKMLILHIQIIKLDSSCLSNLGPYRSGSTYRQSFVPMLGVRFIMHLHISLAMTMVDKKISMPLRCHHRSYHRGSKKNFLICSTMQWVDTKQVRHRRFCCDNRCSNRRFNLFFQVGTTP